MSGGVERMNEYFLVVTRLNAFDDGESFYDFSVVEMRGNKIYFVDSY